ncbi:MAG: FAD-binding oxidoreductase [Parafannyhessea sp.]|uniref:FAD-binding oxidoreductase n=1 Tax=Parafannyhessea sp. TaxID=2847324 RepID=UPI003F0DD67F
MASNLNQVKVADFTRMAAARGEQIRLAVPRELPPEASYSANRLAAELHPDHQHLVVSRVRDVGDGMCCYTLEPDVAAGTSRIAYFAAGQYLSLNLDVRGMPVTRAYSISSSPRMALEGKIEVSVKRVPGGLVSNWIQDNWKVGTKVDASGPLGNFTYEGIRDAGTVIAVAGGSGITPFLSMARAIADGDEDFRLVILYGCRTLDALCFRDELEAIQRQTDKVRVVPVLSDEERPHHEHGFINAELIARYAPAGEYSVFACGPQAMYRFLDGELPKLGLRRKFVRRELMGELHGPKGLDGYPTDADVPESVEVTVIREGSKCTVTGSSDDSVLQILEKNGIAAPSHCRSGECGWCHSRLVSGNVFCPVSVDGRREADRKFGYIHPCVTFPLGDLTIEVPSVR